MSIYKLSYIDARGVCEPIRVMFFLAKVPYDDFRYPLGPNLERTEFIVDQEKGLFNINMGRIPILNVDGHTLGQSDAIARFLAKRFGFFGDNEFDAAMIDMFTEHVRDIKQKYIDAKVGKSMDELHQAKIFWMRNELPTWAKKLESCVGKDGFAVGSKLSLADIVIQVFFQDYFDEKTLANEAIRDCPGLQMIIHNVFELAHNWYGTRPQTVL
jgi:prostaglandin-H2 D-isomerase / glutathione transferase